MAEPEEKALAPLKPSQRRDLDRMARIAKIQDHQAEREVKILAAEHLAAELQECSCGQDPHAEGCAYEGPGKRWTKLERNVARDARKTRKDAPGYLDRIHQRAMARQRAEALRPPPPAALNVAVLVRVSSSKFDVVDVDAEGRVLGRDDE